MNRLIKYFCERTFLVNLLSAFIVIGGLVTLKFIHTDMMPQAERPQIEVSGAMPGASALQIERYVVRRLEDKLSSVASLDDLQSNISNGSFNITLNFNASHVNMLASKDEVEGVVDLVKRDLPESLEDLQVSQSTSRRSGWMGSLNILGLDPEDSSARALSDKVIREFQNLPGIVSVNSELDLRRLIIRLKPAIISNSNLSTDQILNSLRTHLLPKYGGSVEKDSKRINLEILDPPLSLEYFSKLPVITNSLGKTFLLEDLADLEWQYSKNRTLRRLNGETYTRFWLFKNFSTDILDLESKVLSKIEEVNKTILKGTSYRLVSSRLASEFVRTQIETLKSNALLGLLLVILLLGYILGLKSALITAFSVPLAYAFAMVMFSILGISINIVSLVGLILVLGLLVDDAIIVAEKYAQNLEEGMPPKEAAFSSAGQLLAPVTATIATSAIAFLPILAVDGYLKEMFFAIPIVLTATLFASWFESFFILPNHLMHFLKKPIPERSVILRLQEIYEKTLRRSLKHRYIVLLFLGCLAGASVWLATNKIKSRFFLRFGGESIEVSAYLKESTSLKYSEEKMKPIEDYLLALKAKHPEIAEVSFRVGRVWVERQRKIHPRFAEFDIDLESSTTETEANKRKFVKMINEFIEAYPGKDDYERLSVTTRNSRSETNLDQTVSIHFSGNTSRDFESLRMKTEELAQGLPGFTSFSYNEDLLTRAWVFNPDLSALNSLSFSLDDLTKQLSLYTANRKVGNSFLGEEEILIYSAISDFADQPSFEMLNSIELLSDQNILIPISNLGKWTQKDSFDSIFREDGDRILRFDLQFDPELTDSTKFSASVKEKLIPELNEAFPDYKVSSKLANEEAEENQTSILKVALMCLLGIVFILALQLGSITQPFLVASVIPFGVFGALWALYFHGMDLGLMAMVGLLGVAGVAVNDAIVLVDQCNIDKSKALKNDDSLAYIIKGSKSRLRAILLTTLTTLGGLITMAYGIGGDSALTRPIAFSMSWGLMGSTLLTLIALPAFLAVRDDLLRFARKFKPTKEV